MTERWIVGHDGSDGAAVAARWALAQAEGRHAEVTIVRAWQLPALEFPLPADSIKDLEPRQPCSDFDELVEHGAAKGTTVSANIVQGGAARVLLDASDDASMLIVGSRGLGGFRRLLLGSVSSQCATHSRVPTVVVPATSTLDRPVGRITVGIDGSDRSLVALKWAMQFRTEFCSIRVVGAWQESKSGYVQVAQNYGHELRRTRERFDELLDAVEAASPGVERFERHFAHADPATTMLAGADHADLIVVGERGHRGLSAAVLGSVATHLIHHSEIPVAVVPSEH